MFSNTFPNFEKGRILKRQMLENLRDYPRNFLDIYFNNYSDGIIAGADMCIGDNITINKGIVKHHGIIYMLEDNFELPYYPTNKEVLIKIKFLTESYEGDFRLHPSRIFIDDNTVIGDDELELGRFKLREGAVLRSDYKDFYDFSTEFNTVNIINVEYAGFERSTISPMILRYFSNIVLKYNSDNIYDISFAMQCTGEKPVERKLIIHYISNRLGIENKDYSNILIYKHLTTIVRELESGIKRNIDSRPNRPSRILVD